MSGFTLAGGCHWGIALGIKKLRLSHLISKLCEIMLVSER